MDMFILAQFLVASALLLAVSCFSVRWMVQRCQRQARFDQPNHRSMHTNPTPTGAGIVIAIVVLIAIFSSMILGVYASWFPLLIIVGSLAMIGWYDDRNPMSVRIRLLGFLILAVVLLVGIGSVNQISITHDLRIAFQFRWIAWLFTALCFLWLVNLYNFMDGMDGLAGMQSIIAGVVFAYWFYQVDALHLSLICWALVAAASGFLIWNWSPAKIFMGDVGSLSIGGLFACLAVIGVDRYDIPLMAFMLALGPFVFDATFTLFRRLFRGERIYEAHSSHLYQRLAKCGVKHSLIVAIYALLMIISAVLAETLRLQQFSPLITGLMVLIGVVCLLSWVVIAEANVKRNE